MPEVKRQLRRGRNGEIGHAIRAADGDVLEIGTTVTLLAEPEAVQADLPGRVGKCAQLIMAGAVGLCVRGIICPVHRDETVHVDIREGLSVAVGHGAADRRRGLTNHVIDVWDVDAIGHGELQSRSDHVVLSGAARLQLNRPGPAEHAEVEVAVAVRDRRRRRTAVLREREERQTGDGRSAGVGHASKQVSGRALGDKVDEHGLAVGQSDIGALNDVPRETGVLAIGLDEPCAGGHTHGVVAVGVGRGAGLVLIVVVVAEKGDAG